jgi:group I intron endonuclease
MKIYKITNLINYKLYIGQTSKTIEDRWKNHCAKARRKVNRHLYDAMNHYGYDNFKIELLEETDERQANQREVYWIAELKTRHPIGYNMTPGGEGGNTLASKSPEERAKIYKKQGEKRRGPRPDWWKKAIAEGAKRREASYSKEKRIEINQKISRTNKLKGITYPKTALFGKDNPNFIDVDIEKCIAWIADGWTLKWIAEQFSTTAATVGSKLKTSTGKTFSEWRKHYGIKGPYSNPRKSNSAG